MDEEKNYPHHHLNPDQASSPEAKHQPTGDVDVWPVIKFGLGLVFACFLVYLSMSYLWNYFNEREASLETPPSPLISSDTLRLPPEPRLQLAPGHRIHPLEELKQLRASEDALLNSYGWVDQKAGIARIPIDLAKQLVLEKGLPSTPAGRGDPGIPQVSSSGRTWERR
jgi:hypothetical protein